MDDTLGARARGGAAVGAGFGAILGAVIGWLLGAQVTPVPTIGPVVGQWVLTSTLVGLGAGAAIGALIGALAAITVTGKMSTQRDNLEARSTVNDNRDDLISAPEAYESAAMLAPEGVVDLDATVVVPVVASDEAPSVPASAPVRKRPRKRGPIPAASQVEEAAGIEASAEVMEVTDMSDNTKGRDPNTFTGTQDAVDPETGAVGTAGTPVTTGYGVSGSTVGTGSRRKRNKQESGDYRGTTPDSVPYEAGGRETGDAGVLKGSERQASVTEEHSDAGRVEASVPRELEGRDVYEQSEGYVESLERDTVRRRSRRGAKESRGTNIPGTEDPEGLGDNTGK